MNIPYITFDELMASVESDFAVYSRNALINRGNYIKVVRKVNHDLGLKIFKEKEAVLNIENYKADLPVDFLYLQMALGCGEIKMFGTPSIYGTHTQEREVPATCTTPDKACLNSNCDGSAYWVTQTYKDKVITQHHLFPIRITPKSSKFCSEDCVNNRWTAGNEIHIENSEVTASFREGQIYISYLADMSDEDGNLLVLDHPKVTPYYEYAVKKSIIENLLMDGTDDVERKWSLMKNELKEARIEALNFTNTVEYSEIQQFYKANRKRFLNRYTSMFYV